MKKIICFVTCLLLFAKTGTAQKQNNIWYFGTNAGLDFNSGVPVPLTNGQLATTEGCASIADANGNILFYTDGVTVFNSIHATMFNGTGLFGGNSSSQSVTIVPLPGSSNFYYLFTVPDAAGSNGLCYSIVDMNLQGGLGEITLKNVPLHTPVTEKITSARHYNGSDYWILVHEENTDAFYAYLLTSAGVNLIPVISNTGSIHVDWTGHLKVSHDGSMLAVALNNVDLVELFDFDNATGIVSNPLSINGTCQRPYGLEFSPDNSILYVAEAGNSGGPDSLFQFDLLAGTPAAIIASATIVGHSSNNFLGPLQIGPDGKIYVSRYSTGYLGVINDPDQLGIACNYNDTGVFLAGQMATFGLPNQIYLGSGLVSMVGFCLGDSTHFNITQTPNLLGVQWDFADTASGVNNVSYLTNPVHFFSVAGTYNITVLQFYASSTDTVLIPVIIHPLPIVNLGPDTSFCAGNSFVFNAGAGNSTYLWQDNSTDTIFTATLAGTYWVTVLSNGCDASDTVVLSLATCSVPGVNFISSDTTFCGKQCIDFTDLSTNNPTSWQWFFPGADSTYSTLQNPTNICYNSYGTFDVKLIACNAAGCDTLLIPQFITEYQLPVQPVISQGHDTLYSTPSYSYSWYNTINPGVIISSNSYYVFSNGGSYFVIISDSVGCQSSSVVFTATGISEIMNANDSFSISPNPVSDLLAIILNKSLNFSDVELTVTDLIGREFYNSSLRFQETSVDLRKVANGIYFIQLNIGKSIMNKKFMVHH